MKKGEEEITDADLILSANRALLCEVRVNMRRIYVEYLESEKKIVVHFFYDSPPTQEDLDYDVEGTILTEMSCDFFGDIQWDNKWGGRTEKVALGEKLGRLNCPLFRTLPSDWKPKRHLDLASYVNII